MLTQLCHQDSSQGTLFVLIFVRLSRSPRKQLARNGTGAGEEKEGKGEMVEKDLAGGVGED